MRDSIGGIFSLMFIGVFMLIISGYLAFSVSYNKAFRVKNKIIKILEQHEAFDSETKADITAAMEEVGYNTNDKISNVPCNFDCSQPGYCVAWIENGRKNSGYFKVITSSVMNIPILNKIAGVNFLVVTGDTITINPDNGKNPGSEVHSSSSCQ